MNPLSDALHIPDTQSNADARRLAIQRVGIKDLRYPLKLRIAGGVQTTAALWSLDVALPADRKGTHMSRFVAWLDEQWCAEAPLDSTLLRERHGAMLDKLGATEGRIDAAFSFFLRKRAPVSGAQSLLDYQGRWVSETRAGVTTLWQEVSVPVKSLCPCSKEISDYGAHNQRSLVTIRIEAPEGAGDTSPMRWDELVRFAEQAASSEIWALLKRSDEKWVTEQAYENPKFVEDLVRDVALALEADPRVRRYSVDVENFESIHNHSAYARIERG